MVACCRGMKSPRVVGRTQEGGHIDIDLLPRNDDFLDQALRNRLPMGEGKTIEILA